MAVGKEMLIQGREVGSDDQLEEVPMLKAIILGCAICAGVGGTVVWVKSGGNAEATPTAAAASLAPMSIQQLHSNVHNNSLPIQVVEDPF